MKQDRSQKGQKPMQNTTSPSVDDELDNDFEGVIDPVVGRIYHALWEGECSGWYLVVILPYAGDGDWKEVGITGNLFTSGLAEEIPNCFKVVKNTASSRREARLTWAEGYQDGGPRVRSRKFPCLFLHPPLEIPTSDQKFEIDTKAEVLAFLKADHLRHKSTIHSISQDTRAIDAYQHLAEKFEVRQKTIQAKQDTAPGREVDHGSNVGASSIQRPKDIASVGTMGHLGLSTNSNALQEPRQDNARNDLPMSRSEPRYSWDHSELISMEPRASLPNYDGNSLIGEHGGREGALSDQLRANLSPPTPSITNRQSLNGGDDEQSTVNSWVSKMSERQSQPTTLQQKASPYVWQDTSNTSQTGVRPKQKSNASSSDEVSPTEGILVQGMTDWTNDSSHSTDTAKRPVASRTSRHSRPSPSSQGKIQENEPRPQDLKDLRYRTETFTPMPFPKENNLTEASNDNPFGARGKASDSNAPILAEKSRGPTALLPSFRSRKKNAQHSDQVPEQDRTPGLGNTLSTVGGDAEPSSAGHATWPRTYTDMLREPWRTSGQSKAASRGPENP